MTYLVRELASQRSISPSVFWEGIECSNNSELSFAPQYHGHILFFSDIMIYLRRADDNWWTPGLPNFLPLL
jgi:hypothetical protein